jgi:hypothetical protein
VPLFYLEKKAPSMALFSDIAFVTGGKKRGFCRLRDARGYARARWWQVHGHTGV